MKQWIAGFFFIFISIGAILFSYAADSGNSPLAEGSKLYQDYCSSCHGVELQGGNAQSLVDGIWQFGEGRGYLYQSINYGIQHLGMPGYEQTLTEKQVNQIIDFLLESEKSYGAVKPPIPKEIQTRDYTIKVDILADGLEVPWSIDFLHEDYALVTERPGRLRIIQRGQLLPEPVQGTPRVLNEGQGGLLDVAVDPEYDKNGWIYLSYSDELSRMMGMRRSVAMTRIVRGRLKDHKWIDEEVLYEADKDAYGTTRHHYGCRIVFDKKGHLFFGIGERGYQDQAQDLSLPNGKIHRIFKDGKIPPDNPFIHQKDALPTIFCYGIRNPQGMAIHPVTDQLWENEHGPLGGDEINLMLPGKNYGWPVITYGRNYNGTIISELTEKPGMEQPIYYYNPSIAICGMDFVRGELFSKWKNYMLVGALKYEEVRLLDLKENRILHDEVILKNAGRVRDAACGPDGAIYVVLNNPGTILRLSPR